MNNMHPKSGNKEMDKFLEANGIRLHYIHHQGVEPPLILIHGLTGNAHSFDSVCWIGSAWKVLSSGVTPSGDCIEFQDRRVI